MVMMEEPGRPPGLPLRGREAEVPGDRVAAGGDGAPAGAVRELRVADAHMYEEKRKKQLRGSDSPALKQSTVGSPT